MQEITRGASRGVVCDAFDANEQEILQAQQEPQLNEVVLLAQDVLELARSIIVANNQFLAAPIGQLELKPMALSSSLAFATDATTCYFDPDLVLAQFAHTGQAPMHDVIHVLVHYVLLHPYVGSDIEPRNWNLAVDVAAEMLVLEIAGRRDGRRGDSIEHILAQLSKDFAGKLTAERLYRSLKRGDYADIKDEWEPIFRVDDHNAWYPRVSDDLNAQQGANQSSDSLNAASSSQSHMQSQSAPQGGSSSSAQPSEEDIKQQVQDKQTDEAARAGGSKEADLQKQDLATHPQLPAKNLDQVREKWKRAAKSMKVDLETLSRKRGENMGGFMRELEVTQHEQIDYRDFLRQFAIRNEDMRLSDDEFDYVFYTYGLDLYGDMPLIEPLEYKSLKRVRDFVVVIDTSSSVTGKVVQQFIDATFDVLMSSESFFEKVNIHIIQCDTQVRSDTKITSINELDRWRKNIKLYGFGGTDFRPAFTYINKLYHSGEFDDLGGVIYFTDGWGVYPEQMPPYKTAFCFYDEDHRPELVPAWAIQLTLHPGEFESMSVY